MGKYFRNLNAAKLWAAVIAIGTAVMNPTPEVIGVAVATTIAAFAGDKNPEQSPDTPASAPQSSEDRV